MSNLLPDFRGDLAFAYQFEGFGGHPYHPGGKTRGIIIAGIDLGHADWGLIDEALGDVFGPDEMQTLLEVLAVKGQSAANKLKHYQIYEWTYTEDQARTIFGYVGREYWRNITKRFPKLTHADTPAPVQDVFLSLAINRGVNNKALEPLQALLDLNGWAQMATTIQQMQQGHDLEDIRERRRVEGLHIRRYCLSQRRNHA